MKNQKKFVNRVSIWRRTLAGVAALALVGCAHSYRLVPTPGAPATQGPGQAIGGENAGVRMVASAQLWNGDPPNLGEYVLPLWVEIENHSGKALWLRYSSLRLESPSDARVTLHAVPPFRMKGNAIVPIAAVRPEFHAKGFYVAPLLGPSYIGLNDPWEGPLLEPDLGYHVDHYVDWEERLPTGDMLRRAIPEGVVADGGRVSGFVYFQRMKRGSAALTLQNDLIDATTKQPFGRVEISFAVVKE
ncbi:MAG: hypothetical protein WCG85_13760 [Polyangia bacterium]